MYKKTLSLAFLSLLAANFYAQTISNVQSQQQGNDIVVSYTLQCNDGADIGLYISEDGGTNYSGPLNNVSGDVGPGIDPGNKNITWKVLQDRQYLACGNIVFKVKGSVSKFSKLTDSRDGKSYKAVKIGNQTMMAENLAYKPNSGNYWAYDNKPENVAKYGYLYDWKAAQNVCPAGWHLPSKEEFEKLLQNLGGEGKSAYNALIPQGSSGFSALLGGYYYNGHFFGIGTYAIFWSRSPYNLSDAWLLHMNSYNSYANVSYDNEDYGYSVRCFRD